MSLTLTIVSRQSRALGAKASMTFGQDGGTIGRSLQNDWALPDKQKYLSARHASIDFRSGTYYIVDTSKNGVFINGEHEPVGRGKPQRLFDGDRIRIGEYEMACAVENIDDTRDVLIASSHIDPVDLKQKVEAPEPTSYDLVDVHAMTGVITEMELEVEDDEEIEIVLATEPEPAAATPPAPKVIRKQTQAPQAQAAPVRSVPLPDNALAQFYRGLGIDAPRLDSAATDRMLLQIGQLTRELVAGLVDNMQLRAVQKAQIVGSGVAAKASDNELDFSRDVRDNLERLFTKAADKSASPAESVRSAFADLRAHQRALLASNRHALNEYLVRLDPETIEHDVTGGKRGSSSLLSAAQKFRFWDVYKYVFSVLGNRPGDEWPEPFQVALSEAYAKMTAPATGSADEIEEQRQAG